MSPSNDVPVLSAEAVATIQRKREASEALIVTCFGQNTLALCRSVEALRQALTACQQRETVLKASRVVTELERDEYQADSHGWEQAYEKAFARAEAAESRLLVQGEEIARLRELKESAVEILKRFKESEANGASTRDRRYVIDILEFSLGREQANG